MPMEFSGFPRRDSQRVLVITRVFDAPRALVWKAWTDPAHARGWMGPRGFAAIHLEGELRPRGAWRACLRRDDDAEFSQGGVYVEVVAPERLVFSFAWDDANRCRRHETLVTLTFFERHGKTTMSFRQEMFETVEERDRHQVGWNSTFDRLAQHLAGMELN